MSTSGCRAWWRAVMFVALRRRCVWFLCWGPSADPGWCCVARCCACMQACKNVPAAALLSAVERCGGVLLELDLLFCPVREGRGRRHACPWFSIRAIGVHMHAATTVARLTPMPVCGALTYAASDSGGGSGAVGSVPFSASAAPTPKAQRPGLIGCKCCVCYVIDFCTLQPCKLVYGCGVLKGEVIATRLFRVPLAIGNSAWKSKIRKEMKE